MAPRRFGKDNTGPIYRTCPPAPAPYPMNPTEVKQVEEEEEENFYLPLEYFKLKEEKTISGMNRVLKNMNLYNTTASPPNWVYIGAVRDKDSGSIPTAAPPPPRTVDEMFKEELETWAVLQRSGKCFDHLDLALNKQLSTYSEKQPLILNLIEKSN